MSDQQFQTHTWSILSYTIILNKKQTNQTNPMLPSVTVYGGHGIEGCVCVLSFDLLLRVPLSQSQASTINVYVRWREKKNETSQMKSGQNSISLIHNKL